MMLIIFFGDLMLLLGFAVLLLPLLVTELSRPRDAFWGAVGLLLGLSLVSTNDRFHGAPMLAVISGMLLISRLGYEVAQSRWHQLSDAEKNRLVSLERWTSGIKQVWASLAQLGGVFGRLIKFPLPKINSQKSQKKWVRPDKNPLQGSTDQISINSKDLLQSTKNDLEQQSKETSEANSPLEDS